MNGLVLSRREVSELARTPVKARQIAFLRQNGIRHYVDVHGWPVVLRSSIEPEKGGSNGGRAPWKSNKATAA